MRVTTDLGDWATIPVRVRIGFLAILVFGIGTGLAAGTELIGVPAAVLIVANGGLATQWVFTRRRPWWPAEPEWPTDIIDRHFSRRLVGVAIINAVVLLLAALAIVRL